MRTYWIVFALICCTMISCGPDTIFVRPRLDTPEQHVVAGYQLFQRGKLEDAYREFDRARELEPNFIKAYIGLGLTLAQKGKIDAGQAFLNLAKQMANTSEALKDVQKGYQKLEEIKRTHTGLDSP
jgi:tetratricopeptide (TPR) repeat protein